MNPRSRATAGPCGAIEARIRSVLGSRRPPIVVALDGGSGSGKSTLAAALAEAMDCAWVSMDDFFAAHVPDREWDRMPVAERAGRAFDWSRLRREALAPLLAGEPACWRPFDFEAGMRPDGTYAMSREQKTCGPAPVVLLDGAYSARPELADLVDLAVLVDTPIALRHRRLAAREDPSFLARWHAVWDAVEAEHLDRVRPRSSFDLVVPGGTPP